VAPAIRPFEERDYPRLAEISAAIDPDASRSPDWFRRRDRAWNPAHPRVRLVADVAGRAVGWGDIGTMWWSYHPRKLNLRLSVDPAEQGHGIGSALYERLLEACRPWDPLLVRAETRETRPRAVRFLEARGFAEIRRRWESCLRLDRVQLDQFAGAESRVTEQGIRLTTLAAERARRNVPLLREVFDLEMAAAQDEPGYDPSGAMSFDQYVAHEFDTPEASPAAAFVALDGERLVGVSRLTYGAGAAPGVIHVGFTGVHPEYRGRGIAVALKLRTIDYARAHGYTSIRTQNDATNAAMLHINAALGFQTEPAWCVFERRVSTA